MGEQGEQHAPDLTGGWAHGPYAAPTGPATWTPPLVQRRPRRSRGPWLVVAALVVVLLVGAGLFLFRGDPLTLGGRYVTEPEAVLADADDVLAGYVEDRHGAASDDSRCWFELADAEGHEVTDTLLCGPVLFVDGDPERSWLRFPLTAAPDGGDVRLSVEPLPADPEPERLADPALLHRPDGGTPPDGSGGLEVPAPPQAEPGWSATGPFPDVTWTPPAGPSRLSGPAAAVAVTGLAQPDRVGSGDDARRAADGERLVAVRYAITAGEGTSSAPPALSYQVSGADPVPVGPALVAPGSTVEAVLSVPEDAEQADLVVDDAGVQQRLSLLTGAPGTGNLQVLARTNRTAEVNAAPQLVGTLSAPDRVAAQFPFTVTVTRATLAWWAGPGGAKQPADPGRAFLVVDVALAIPDTPPGAVPIEYLSLLLPDGTVLRAADLADDPAFVLPAFDVPADFTAGMLLFGGVATFPDGAVADFGGGRLDVPIGIPAG
ncbi:hypothetical protein [Modestobacter versicolor]|uniref:Uncharacterized protein n=1 Tax=Modestobacter versicolor TaxID=429133 RepID=A0A323V3X7_9ACTN|nr:hypothetical protein [Modestobacter versicolor]MBB3677857.1 hypothetical protein [Modestobacter versicolor]PZA19537.1 hypothetical protein DMO24_20215 [Modestobacter versicolor]